MIYNLNERIESFRGREAEIHRFIDDTKGKLENITDN
jgi:hypothetical protein